MKSGSWWYEVIGVGLLTVILKDYSSEMIVKRLRFGKLRQCCVGDECEIIADEDGVPMHVLVRHQKKNR